MNDAQYPTILSGDLVSKAGTALDNHCHFIESHFGFILLFNVKCGVEGADSPLPQPDRHHSEGER
jgi:hypothetical protein